MTLKEELPRQADNYFELQYVGLDKGREIVRKVSVDRQFSYPSYKPVLDQRWRALTTRWNESGNIDPELQKILQILLEICAAQNLMAEQREIYYATRGEYPDLEVDGKPWADLYDTFIGNYINKVQLLTGIPMQSFGVEAGARGSVAGEGFLILEDGKKIPLNAEPKLRFELTRGGVKYVGHARKHIQYEKEAGFARLISGDIAQMVEAVFSTSQGYSSEAASKLIRDSEERGLQAYCLHDADPHGLQMQMMYGVASKNNCYMTDRFYPCDVIYLGLVPSVARALGLPPEKVEDVDRKIIPNLRILLQEKGEFVGDVDIIDELGEKWEWQALNALHERAPQVYMVEALRARNDEMKHVPLASELKQAISAGIVSDVHSLVDKEIGDYADNFYQEHIKPQLVDELSAKLTSDIIGFKFMMEEELPKLDAMPDEVVREAVKLKLVENPRLFWDNAQGQVMRDMLRERFDIEADVEWDVSVTDAKADTELVVGEPKVPDKPLTKTDITDSIMRRIVTQKPARDKVAVPIRKALEEVFGEPDEEW